MRVCIVGNHSMPLDEGMKKTTYALVSALSRRCDVLALNPLDVGSLIFWSALIRHHPEVIHYIPGPSLYSFILLALMKRATSAATVMSLTHPDPALPKRSSCRFFKPDLLLSQTLETEEEFQALGCKLAYLPNGVDTRRFYPVSNAKKLELRRRYGIPQDAFVVLHVGNTRQVRNLESLIALQGEGTQVVVVSSTTIQGDAGIDTQLKAAGCQVLDQYIEVIEEVYMLADCYVFPTVDTVGAIAHPLSVMEAMACNLPVVSRRFGALPRIFEPGDGLYFFETDEELAAQVKALRIDPGVVATRDKVQQMDWDAIAQKALHLYQELCNEKTGGGN